MKILPEKERPEDQDTGWLAKIPLVCSKRCPYPDCPLVSMGKNPVGQRCPLELQYAVHVFAGWMDDLGRTFDDISETERSQIAALVTLDVHERRCAAILSKPQNAALDTPAGRGAVARFINIIKKQRRILRALELTPEMQTKKKIALARLKPGAGTDLASRQCANADKIRRAYRESAT
jgi:hypothetical protein